MKHHISPGKSWVWNVFCKLGSECCEGTLTLAGCSVLGPSGCYLTGQCCGCMLDLKPILLYTCVFRAEFHECCGVGVLRWPAILLASKDPKSLGLLLMAWPLGILLDPRLTLHEGGGSFFLSNVLVFWPLKVGSFLQGSPLSYSSRGVLRSHLQTSSTMHAWPFFGVIVGCRLPLHIPPIVLLCWGFLEVESTLLNTQVSLTWTWMGL